MIKAIIWDLDGVIIESESFHIKAEIETLNQEGIKLTEDIAKKYFGLRTEDYFKELSKYYGVELPINKMLKTHAETLAKYYEEVPLAPHIKETLEMLHSKYKMGLATSTRKELAEIPLKKFSLLKYFQAQIFGEMVREGKPNPEMFLKAASALAVEPKEAVVIEDSENGFKAGKKAGMIVIGRKAEHNKGQDFSSADYIISDVKGIQKLLENL